MTAILDEHQIWIENGSALVNASVYFGAVGQNPQTTAISVFSDQDLTVAAANPQLTGADGRLVTKLFLSGPYSIEVVKSNLVQNYIELFNGSTGSESATATKVITVLDSPYQVTLDDANSVIQVDASGGPINITLAVAFDAGSGGRIGFKRIDSVVTNAVSMVGSGGELLEGKSSFQLAKENQAVEFFSDGVDEWLISPNNLLPGPNEFISKGDESDEAVEFQAFIDGLAEGAMIDLQGQNIFLGTTITITTSNLKFFNGTLSVHANMTGSQPRLVHVLGTLGSSLALTANYNRTQTDLDIADTSSLSADQIIRLTSDEIYGDGTNLCASVVPIRSIASGTVIDLFAPLTQSYPLTENPIIQPLTTVDNVVFDNVTLVGDTTSSSDIALEFQYCRKCRFQNSKIIGFYQRGVNINSSYDIDVSANEIEIDGGVLMYGVAIVTGCATIRIFDNNFNRCRHGVTVGGNFVNRDIWIERNIVWGATDAGLDTHGGADHVSIIDNIIYVEGSNGENDGIIAQGTNPIITGNRIYGNVRQGIFWQQLAYEIIDGQDSVGTISNNDIDADILAVGIDVQTEQGSDGAETPKQITGLTMTGNNVTCRTGYTALAVRIFAREASIFNIVVDGNSIKKFGDIANSHGILIRAATGFVLENYSISNNTLFGSTLKLADGIELIGADANSIEFGTISGNLIRNALVGINGGAGDRNSCAVGNTLINITSVGTEIQLASSTVANNHIA